MSHQRKQRFRNAGAGKGVKELLDRATLNHLSLELGLTQAEIARRYGCSPQFVSLLAREYGIRGVSPSSRKRPD